MPIIAKKAKSEFEPAPEGLWAGVCCDVVDKGVQPTQWGPKHKVQIRWLVNARPARSDGKPHMISKSYTLSLHEKSNLRQMLEVWRGKKFTDAELEGFDLETLLRKPCQIQVAQEKGKDGDTYSFPQAIIRASSTTPLVKIPDDYVRAQDRPDYKPPVAEGAAEEFEPDYSAPVEDEDIPF